MALTISVLGGLIWGASAALLGGALSKAALRSGTASGVMASSLSRTAVDIGALAAVYLLRGVIPMEWEAAMISAAVGLTGVGFYLAWRLSRKVRDGQEVDG